MPLQKPQHGAQHGAPYTHAVHPTVQQTAAIVALLGNDLWLAGRFLCQLGLTYRQASLLLDAATPNESQTSPLIFCIDVQKNPT